MSAQAEPRWGMQPKVEAKEVQGHGGAVTWGGEEPHNDLFSPWRLRN